MRQRNYPVSFKVKMPGIILFFDKIDFKVTFTHNKILAICLDVAGPYQTLRPGLSYTQSQSLGVLMPLSTCGCMETPKAGD